MYYFIFIALFIFIILFLYVYLAFLNIQLSKIIFQPLQDFFVT